MATIRIRWWVLGDENKLEKQLDKAISDSVVAYKKYDDLRESKAQMEIQVEGQQTQAKSYDLELDSLKALRDSASQSYEAVDMSFEKFLSRIKGKSTSILSAQFSPDIARYYTSYDSAAQLNPSGRRGRKAKRRALKSAEWRLKRAFKDLKSARFEEWKGRKNDHQLKTYSRDQDRSFRSVEKLKKRIRHLTIEVQEAKANLVSARKRVNTLWRATQKAYKESENEFNVAHPKLLAVVPCYVVSFIDLEKVRYDFQGDTLVTVRVDSIRLSDVNVIIDSSHYYNIAKREVELRVEQEGLYHQVFEELRLQMETIQTEVKQKALKSRIMEKSCQQVNAYFGSMMKSYGYQVRVVVAGEECSPPTFYKVPKVSGKN